MQFTPTLAIVNAIRESRFGPPKRLARPVGRRGFLLSRRPATDPVTIVCGPRCVTA